MNRRRRRCRTGWGFLAFRAREAATWVPALDHEFVAHQGAHERAEPEGCTARLVRSRAVPIVSRLALTSGFSSLAPMRQVTACLP